NRFCPNHCPTPPVYKETGYSGLTKTSTALPRLSSKRTIL
ncbi:branched-chain amino acid permease, partial [Neisseria meningitidis]